jgi:hypothetical protein
MTRERYGDVKRLLISGYEFDTSYKEEVLEEAAREYIKIRDREIVIEEVACRLYGEFVASTSRYSLEWMELPQMVKDAWYQVVKTMIREVLGNDESV